MDQRLTFPKQRRLHADRDFQRILAAGRRAEDALLVVFVDENECGFSRLGLRAAKRVGTAPQRNRLRRLVREAFRLDQHSLPGGLDVVCSVKRAETGSLAHYRRSLANLIARAQNRRPRTP